MSQWKCSHCDGPIGSLAGLAGGTITCPYCLAPVAISPRHATERSPAFLKRALLVGLFLGLASAGALGLLLKSDPFSLVRTWQDDLAGHPVVTQAEKEGSQVASRQIACAELGQAQAGTAENASGGKSAAGDELASLPEPVVGSEPQTVTSSRPVNLGLSCDEMVHLIQQYYPAEFYAQTPLDSSVQYLKAKIDGAEVILWSHEGQLESVTISGRFDSTNLALLLATIIDRIMPNWGIENAGDWFSKAIHRCDEETLVSTLCDDVELTITTADERSAFWVFFQPDWS